MAYTHPLDHHYADIRGLGLGSAFAINPKCRPIQLTGEERFGTREDETDGSRESHELSKNSWKFLADPGHGKRPSGQICIADVTLLYPFPDRTQMVAYSEHHKCRVARSAWLSTIHICKESWEEHSQAFASFIAILATGSSVVVPIFALTVNHNS
ncbi:hypothetical protein F4809DRAFT_643744 [Biscogniauxia mediterranea]|nr:hypothetical protein F4809DRAFT_643744 [Biscogniauxia mediterranea]